MLDCAGQSHAIVLLSTVNEVTDNRASETEDRGPTIDIHTVILFKIAWTRRFPVWLTIRHLVGDYLPIPDIIGDRGNISQLIAVVDPEDLIHIDDLFNKLKSFS